MHMLVNEQVKVIVTASGEFFLNKAKEYNATAWTQFAQQSRAHGEPQRSPRDIEIVRDAHEWNAWHVVGDRVLHIDVRTKRLVAKQ